MVRRTVQSKLHEDVEAHLVNLLVEPADQQVNTQRSCVLALAKDSDDRMLSSELVDFVDIIDEVKCVAWCGSIKSNILGAGSPAESGEEGLRCWESIAQE